MTRNYKYLWIALGAMIILTPLGLLATGTAWGEWGADELGEVLGYIPRGLEKLSASWSIAPLPDYSISVLSGGFIMEAAGYILSAIVGVLLVIGITQLIGKMIPAEQEEING